jgi:AraC-like DNA-binding protein/mannose-6-phosphate isomerase-like protein (cupin superfamily)
MLLDEMQAYLFEGLGHSGRSEWSSIVDFLGSSVTPVSSRNCGIWECGPGWRWRMTLTDFDLWFATRGRGRMVVTNEDLEYEIRPGMMFLLRPGDTVAADQDPDDPLTVVAVHVQFYQGSTGNVADVPETILPNRCVPIRDPGNLETQMVRLVRLDTRRDRLSQLESTLLIQQILIKVYRQDAENCGFVDHRGTARFDRLIAHLDQVPREWMTLAGAAQFVGLSADYFSRRFAHEFGVGFRTFCMERRLDRAHRLLHETELTIGEIAESLGYADVSLFSRQYKQHFGLSPKRSRNSTTG